MTEQFDNIKTYWDWAHESNNRSSLTGNTLAGHLAFLAAEALLQPTSHVLCIGIGMADWVKELSEFLRGGLLYALDISGIARSKVAGIASTCSPEGLYQLKPQNAFDLALSCWVAPHMSASQVEEQIRAIIPALTSTGTFAIHYNEPFPGTTFDEAEFVRRHSTYAEALRTGLFRMTRERFDGIVQSAGGKVVKRQMRREAPEFDEVIFAAHIQRER